MIAALDELAERFLDTVEEMTVGTDKRGPSIAGFAELADRMDGKSSQAVEVTAEITNRAAAMSDDALAEIAANAGNRAPT